MLSPMGVDERERNQLQVNPFLYFFFLFFVTVTPLKFDPFPRQNEGYVHHDFD